LIRAALKAHPGEVFLEVRESNTAARALYAKLGFSDAGTRPKYYSEPEESAVVMRIRS
jgi:ribosomal-protein-alanine N-acetyltransferase